MGSIKTSQSVEDYLSNYPADIQKKLTDIRSVIKKAAPDAVEKISYGMPAYTFKGMLLYFAAHSKHIGLYPFTTAIESFKKELLPYKTARGSIQFPLDKPLPLRLIADITAFRVQENILKEELRSLKKKRKRINR